LRELAPPGQEGRLIADCLSELRIQLSPEESDLLRRVGWAPFSLCELEAHDQQVMERLRSQGVVLDANEAFELHRIRQLDIEINSHCNFRCDFCPVAQTPLPKKHMAAEVFATVVNRAVEYGVHTFALNHYGEPTLDPNLVERVQIAAAHSIHVVLYTNGSRLKPATSRALSECGNVQVVVNVPSADPERYRALTRWNGDDVVIENI
jgi:sulfatase maturation enzyme AslB (radical SAM superfamily)